MRRLNNQFDLRNVITDEIINRPIEPILSSDFFPTARQYLNILPDILPMAIDTAIPGIYPPALRNPKRIKGQWMNKLGDLKKSLSKNVKDLSREIGPDVARYLISDALFSLGTIGAKKIGNYLFGNTKKYSHKHFLKYGNEIKLLDQIFEDSSKEEIAKKINEILRIKYNAGVASVIKDINSGKYDHLYINN